MSRCGVKYGTEMEIVDLLVLVFPDGVAGIGPDKDIFKVPGG